MPVSLYPKFVPSLTIFVVIFVCDSPGHLATITAARNHDFAWVERSILPIQSNNICRKDFAFWLIILKRFFKAKH